jgi:hypothetical protein
MFSALGQAAKIGFPLLAKNVARPTAAIGGFSALGGGGRAVVEAARDDVDWGGEVLPSAIGAGLASLPWFTPVARVPLFGRLVRKYPRSTKLGLTLPGASLAIGPIFDDGPKKTSKGKKAPEFQLDRSIFGASPVGEAGFDFGGMIRDAQEAAGPRNELPPYFHYFNDRNVLEAVNQDIAAMQSPYYQQIASRRTAGKAHKATIKEAQKEYQRMSRNLQREVKARRDAYTKGAASRASEAEDALTRVADRLLGSTVTSETSTRERAEQVLESAGRERADIERASELGAEGSLSTSGLLADMEAVEQMRSARDIRDASEQTQADIDEINAQIAAVAAQAPQLRNKYATDLANYELKRLEAANKDRDAAFEAMLGLQIAALKGAASGGGKKRSFEDWINDASKIAGSNVREVFTEETGESIGKTTRPEDIANHPVLGPILRELYVQDDETAARFMGEVSRGLDSGFTLNDIARSIS